MSRDEFRALMQGLRSEARVRSNAQWHCAPSRTFECNGALYGVTARRLSGQLGAYDIRTRMLSERPRRALAADALQWAAYYRRKARAEPLQRRSHLLGARACIAEAAAYRTAFNALPGAESMQ